MVVQWVDNATIYMYLLLVALKEAIPCLYKPLKSLHMSQTSQTKLN